MRPIVIFFVFFGLVENVPYNPLLLNSLEARQQYQASDFVFDLLNQPTRYEENGGVLLTVSKTEMPTLQGKGLSQVFVNLPPCTGIVPHVVQSGSIFLYVTFVFSNTLFYQYFDKI